MQLLKNLVYTSTSSAHSFSKFIFFFFFYDRSGEKTEKLLHARDAEEFSETIAVKQRDGPHLLLAKLRTGALTPPPKQFHAERKPEGPPPAPGLAKRPRP